MSRAAQELDRLAPLLDGLEVLVLASADDLPEVGASMRVVDPRDGLPKLGVACYDVAVLLDALMAVGDMAMLLARLAVALRAGGCVHVSAGGVVEQTILTDDLLPAAEAGGWKYRLLVGHAGISVRLTVA